MVAPAGQHEVLLYQRDELDVRVLAAHHVDTEVGLAAQHGFEAVVGAEVKQTDADFRILLVVVADHRRQEVERCGRDTGQRDLAGLAFGQFADAEDRVLEIIQQAPRLGQEVAAHAGQADPAGGAFQQRGAQAFLKLLDAPAQGWLGQVQRLGGFMEAAKFGDFDERSNVLKLIFHKDACYRPAVLLICITQ
ncbi:hypothetical protein D9M71_539790 [compost metagenome]